MGRTPGHNRQDTTSPRTRKHCLRCEHPFGSTGADNRLCDRCRDWLRREDGSGVPTGRLRWRRLLDLDE
jgi:hypothetical protein